MLNILPRGHIALAVLVLLAVGFLVPRPAQAYVQCTATYTQGNFGGGTSYTGTISYTCTNQSATASASFTLCGALGTTRYGTAAQPELHDPAGGGATLNFNLYTNPTYTAPWTTTNLLEASVPALAGHGSTTGTLTYYGLIAPGQSGLAGTYTDRFTATVLGFLTAGSCQENITGGNQGSSGTLRITNTLTDFCSVSATNVALGTVLDTATNVTGTGTIDVVCPAIQYYVGLAPSNGSTTGAGTLTGSTGNTNKVPYQLYQNAGHTTIWGNTATATSAGNGQGGTGNGGAQGYTVYVLLPSANYQADTYADTVTVTVNY